MIKELTLRDIDAFLTFRKKMSSESEYVNPMSREVATSLLKDISSDTDKFAFVAMDKGAVVGQLFLIVLGDALRVQLISVLVEHRGHGLARQLIDKAKEIAKARDLFEIELIVRDENTHAIRFYKKCGFKFKKAYNKTNGIYVFTVKRRKDPLFRDW